MSGMRVPGWKRIRQAGLWLRSRRQPRVVILGYHRVGEYSSDPFDLTVTPGELDEHLQFLERHARPVALQQAIGELARGTIPPRTVVVTFDDGYEDTLTEALPLLRKHRVPATVFVTTGNTGESFWWDVLAACLSGAAQLPDTIAIDVSGKQQLYATRDRAHLLQQVATLLRPLPAAERTAILSGLSRDTGSPISPDLPRALRHDEIERLAAEPLVEVGAHSVTHPPLAQVQAERQRMEIVESRRTLETLTRKPIRSFSYPHGSLGDVTRELVREAGFTVACCSVPDVATPASDPLAFPRLWVDGDRKRDLARWINRWLG